MGFLWSLRYADPVLFLLMGMRSLESVVIPVLLADRVAADLNISNYSHLERQPCHDNSTADEAMVQSVASRWAMAYWLASSLPGAVTAVLIGGWSDRIGRRFPILLAEAGYAIEAGTAMLTYVFNLPLEVLITGSAIEGACGSYPTVLMAVYAHTSDFSSTRQRTSRLMLLAFLEYCGVGICQVVAGLMLKSRGVFQTESIVLGGHVAALLYAGFLLQDSRSKEDHTSMKQNGNIQDSHGPSPVELHTQPAGENKNSYWYSVKKTFRLVLRPWPHRGQLIVLLFSFELLVMNYLGTGDIFVLYTMHHPLCWPSTIIGYFHGSRVAGGAATLLVVAPLIRYFQPPDRLVSQVSMLGIVAYFAIAAFSSSTWMMFASLGTTLLSGPCISTMRSMVSKLVPEVDHGAAFATIASLETIITVLATVIYNNLYSFLIEGPAIPHLPNPGSVCFLLAAGLNLLPFFVMCLLPIRNQSDYVPIPG